MVYKIDKCRVHSGNTLRASNSRYNRQYRKQSCLVRQSQNVAKVTTILEELGLNMDNVAYSLNKKGRWLVPQVLKHEILTGSQAFDDVKVNLVESHKLKKQAKCTGFHSNKGLLRRVIPKGKTYFNSRSVLGHQEESTTPTMTVNVLYPCPVTSSITHNPKYIRAEEHTPGDFELDSTDKIPKQTNPIKSKSKKNRRKIGTKRILNDFLDDVEYLESEEHDFDDPCRVDDVCKRSNTVSVDDLLHHSWRMQSNLRETTMKKSTNHCSEFKDKIVYMERPQEGVDKNDTNRTDYRKPAQPTALTPGAKVFIPNSDVIPERLLDTYGKDYTECHCYPRKFIIDITKRVKKTTSNSKAFYDQDMQSVDFSSALVFVYDMFGGIDSADLGLFRVSLNMNTTLNYKLNINTILEEDVLAVEGVINGATKYIGTIPYDQFVHKSPAYNCSSSSTTDFEMLSKSIGPITKTFTPDYVTVQDIINNKDEAETHGISQACLGMVTPPPDICSICFGPISEGSATALQSCGHWFCNTCWNEHLIASENGVLGAVTCPEYNCKSKVVFNVLLTMSHFRLVERIFRRIRNNIIETDSNTKWCPNKNCGRIVKYKKTSKGQCSNVTCDCGTQMCFDCLQPAHWPLPCDQYTSYAAQLRENGDDRFYIKASSDTRIDFIRGKECPKCKRFIEKDGGCFHMTCVCNTSFCWGCGKPFPGHVITSSCNYSGRRNDDGNGFRATAVELIDEVKSTAPVSSNAYKHAVQNRFLRQPANVRRMSSVVHGISLRLLILNRRHGNRIGGELAEFQPSKSAHDLSVREKFGPFLHSMVRVYIEISHITEYTTIFLASANNMERIGPSKHVVSAILHHLEGLGEEIVFIFRLASQQETRNCISRLWQVRLQCRKAVDNLFKLISC
ncbi:uncharacterized protein LOC117340295 [Pecten maximus]|uniref:uncharacterized protein LOC117340295 n=1 Tax=Pecten maximus TaxID=6579 RepID=UPI00145910AF|nr:uncharacterized protein LOC117340295 [Pecten maximus]